MPSPISSGASKPTSAAMSRYVLTLGPLTEALDLEALSRRHVAMYLIIHAIHRDSEIGGGPGPARGRSGPIASARRRGRSGGRVTQTAGSVRRPGAGAGSRPTRPPPGRGGA